MLSRLVPSQSDTHISPFIFILKISKQLGGEGAESTDGFTTTTAASLVRAKDDSGFVKWYLLAFTPPLFTFFFWVFLFCPINLSLKIFKKCSYDLFDFF